MSTVAASLETPNDLVSPDDTAHDAGPGDAWTLFHRRWSRLGPPQRPSRSVSNLVRSFIAPHDERVLLMGVTPELAGLARQTVAVDWSDGTIAHVWPGNSAGRQAVRGNWLELPYAAQSFSGAMGDGSLNCLAYPVDYRRVFQELARVLRPGARVVVRVYLTPEPCESLPQVRERTLAGEVASIHALKWQIAQALCADDGDPNIPVDVIARAFDDEFPHRRALAAVTGWSREDIAQIDDYRGRPEVYSFPTARQVMAVVPADFASLRFAPTRDYPLADRCPLLVLGKR